jgi:hypothetical protein
MFAFITLSLLTISLQLPKCARYTCSSNKYKECAFSHFDTNTQYSSVSLDNICNKTEYCYVDFVPWSKFTNTTDNDIRGKCRNKYETIERDLRLPGEPCNEINRCYDLDLNPLVGKCVGSICTGMKPNEICKFNYECLAGKYCKAGICTPQQKEGETCSSHYDCLNSLVCINNTCNNGYYSLPVGSKVSDSEFYLCESNIVINGVCTYYKPTDDKLLKKGNLTVCEFGQSCNYTLHDGSQVVQPCECGYNSYGVGYCPRGYEERIFV